MALICNRTLKWDEEVSAMKPRRDTASWTNNAVNNLGLSCYEGDIELDIVKRAYLMVIKEWPQNAEIIGLQEAVRNEVKRLIKARAYDGRDWPREFGPLPEELKKKGRKKISKDLGDRWLYCSYRFTCEKKIRCLECEILANAFQRGSEAGEEYDEP